jgi:hypothetical protein
MKKTLAALSIIALAAATFAAPAPYPVTINSRAQTAPPLFSFRANELTIRASFTDGADASDLTGQLPFLNWATNATTAINSTSSWAFVGSPTNGVVDFTFAPTAVNYAGGRYVYEVGVATSNGTPRTYRQGVFTIYPSPIGQGVAAVNWTTNVNWNAITWQNLPAFVYSSELGASGTVWRAEWQGYSDNLITTGTAYSAISATTAGTVTGAQSNLIATALQAESDTLQDVVTRGGTVTSGAVTIDAANAGTNTYGGYLVKLGSRVSAGTQTTASGNYSFALGNKTTASGLGSFSSGNTSKATNSYSFAIGNASEAYGYASFSHGRDTTASGYASEAGGYETTASGDYSHADGFRARATNDYSFVWAATGSAYYSNGDSTYNINPVGGLAGVYVGETNLATTLAGYLPLTGGTLTGPLDGVSFGGLSITNAFGTRNEIVMAPTNNADLLRVELEPGANVTGMFIGRPGATVPPGANGSYMCYIKAPASGTYNHALGLESGKSNGEILHLYNKDQKHIARFNTDASEELNVRWGRPDGQDQF